MNGPVQVSTPLIIGAFIGFVLLFGGLALLLMRVNKRVVREQAAVQAGAGAHSRPNASSESKSVSSGAVAKSVAAAPGPALAANYTARAANGHHVFIVGGSGKGKTTESRRIIAERGGPCIVLDPHASPGEWPAGTIVIGGGLDYAGINAALLALGELHRQRHQARARGESTGERITVLIDEWRSVHRQCADAKECVLTMLAEDRKVEIHLMLLNQSRTVRSLGMDGEGELRESFSHVLDLRDRTLADEDGVRWTLPPFSVPTDAELEAYRVQGIRTPQNDILALLERAAEQAEQARLNAEQPNEAPIDPALVAEVQRLVEGGMGESAAIEKAFGVRRGGSKVFVAARAAVRAAQPDEDE